MAESKPIVGVDISGGQVAPKGDVVGRDKIVYEVTASPVRALHQLPSPPADFTGRAEELAELLQAVKKNGVTISGLQGMGGVGKTALALKLAEQLQRDYPDGQFYLDLKGVSKEPLSPKEAMAHVIRGYDLTAQLPEAEADVTPLYRSVLHNKKALLLMDNARDAQQVEPLIPPHGCLLLVTSRRHFTLPGLVKKNLDALPPADAQALLLQITPRVAQAGTQCIADLAQLCGHLPLALRAVGSALKERINLSPAGYASKLQEISKRRKELSQVDVSLQVSYDLLVGELQKRFRTLAVFPDTFDLAAAAAIWEEESDDAETQLGELLLYSLIAFDDVSRRYHLHDLVRLFVGGRLEVEDRQILQGSHARHYLEVVRTASDLYQQGRESVIKGLALFDLEWSNIQAAQAWAATQAAHDASAADLCCAYPLAGAELLILRQHPREQIRWLEPALAAAQDLKVRAAEMAALNDLGIAYKKLGEYRQAIEYHERSMRIAREVSDLRSEGTSLGNLGIAYRNLGEYRRAIEYQEQHLHIARKIGDPQAEDQALGNLGNAYLSLGEYRRAIEYHKQSIRIARERGDHRSEGQSLGSLGVAYHSLGEYGRAIEHCEQYLQISQQIGDRENEGSALWNSSVAFERLGNRQTAIANAEAALRIFEQIDSPHGSRVRSQLAKWRNEEKDHSAE